MLSVRHAFRDSTLLVQSKLCSGSLWRQSRLQASGNLRRLSGRAPPPPWRSGPTGGSIAPRVWFQSLNKIPTNIVFWSIVGINGAVFAAWHLAETQAKVEHDQGPVRAMMKNFTTSVSNVWNGRPWTLVTHMFSHEQPMHILMNGLGLFWIAKPVLESLGSRTFLMLYLGSGIASAIGTVGVKLYSRTDYSSMGASGALCGTMGFLACSAPFMPFYLYGILKVPAWGCVAGLFCWDLYSAVTDRRGSTRTDFWGHVMGTCAGAGYYFILRRAGFASRIR